MRGDMATNRAVTDRSDGHAREPYVCTLVTSWPA